MDAETTALRFAAALDRDGADVVVTWMSATGGVSDPVRRIWTGEVVTPHSVAAKCSFYSINYAQVQAMSRWAEQPVEPVMLDFAPEVVAPLLFPPAGTRISQVRFALNGTVYVPAKQGRELTSAMDAVIGSTAISRTLLVGRGS